MQRLLVIGFLFVAILAGWLLISVGVPDFMGVTLGLVVSGCLGLLAGRRFELLHSNGTNNLTVMGGVFIGLGALMLITEVVRLLDRTTPGLNSGLVIVVMLAAELAALCVVIDISRRIGRRTRAAQRQQLAQRSGWRFEQLAPSLEEVVKAAGGRKSQGHGVARAVIHGTLSGVPFTVFDFDRKEKGLLTPVSCTAWTVRLPMALPYVSGTFVLYLHRERAEQAIAAGRPIPTSTDPATVLVAKMQPSTFTDAPDLARLLMTPQVEEATRRDDIAWWISGNHLLQVDHGKPAAGTDRVVHGAELLTRLARLLPLQAAEPFRLDRPSAGEPQL